MKCSLKNRELKIQEYLSGQISENDRQEFEKHLFGCDECFQELMIYEQTFHLIKDEGNEIFDAYLKRKEILEREKKLSVQSRYFRIHWIAIPAAALIILIAGYLILNITNKKPSEHHIVFNIFKKNNEKNAVVSEKDKDNTIIRLQDQKTDKNQFPLVDDRNLIAENFTTSPNFENLISQEIRNDYNVEITAPALNLVLKSGEITFSWKTNFTETLFLKIYNNKEKLVFSINTTKKQLKVTIEYKPGLYYWKLETEENLLYIGKFMMK